MNAIFWAALLAGFTYWPGSELPVSPLLLIAWKGAGVGLLAFWAAMRARSFDGWLLALVMALGAAGDILIEAIGLEAGAAAFLVGHLVAIGLYARNRGRDAGWHSLLAVPVIVAVAALLPADRSATPGVAVYSLGLAAMAGFAWMSRFRIAAAGAWLFVASDLLIFARLGPLAGSFLPDLLVWPFYFIGQAMIAWDVGCAVPSHHAPENAQSACASQSIP